jgi:hypothetical protein
MDSAALVELEERGVPEALLGAGSAGREGRASVLLLFFHIETLFRAAESNKDVFWCGFCL